MNKIITIFSILIVGCFLGGCGGGNGGGSESYDTAFYDATREVLPVIGEGVSGSLSEPATGLKELTTEWTGGNPLYEVFYILQDFHDPEDQGVIDTSNIQKTMWDSRGFLTGTISGCAFIDEQVIAPPFPFGNEDETYNCALNTVADDGYHFGGAIKQLDGNGTIIGEGSGEEEGEEAEEDLTETAVSKLGVFGFVWVDSITGHNEYGTLQAAYSSATEDLSVDIAIWVNYDVEDDYCYRNDIDGNAGTHLFTIRSIKGNKVEGSNFISIVGKGHSEGAGNYFLLRVSTSDVTDSYYCLGADDGEAELQLMAAAGSAEVDPECADYEDDVVTMTPLTTDDLACGAADFSDGKTIGDVPVPIFLNFVE